MEKVPYRKDDFFTLGDYEYGSYFAKRGYVVARVDVRGTGGSGGSIPVSEYSEAEISDAEELVAQLAKKSWSNGNVGMYGISWSAFNSLMTAHRKPPALKAIIAAHGSTPGFTHLFSGADTWIELPVVPTQSETSPSCVLPPPEPSDQAPFGKESPSKGPVFESVRNEQTGDSTFITTNDTSWTLYDNTYRSTELYRWDVNDAAPAKARFRGERRNVFTISGTEIDLSTLSQIESDDTYFHITFTKTLRQNGKLVRERTWTDHILRRYQ